MFFGIKKFLAGHATWGIRKGAIRIDETTNTMKVADKPVMKVEATEDKLKITWLCKEWETWQEFQEAPEFKDIAEKCRKDLTEAKLRQGKGLGKGKTQTE